jgi:PAS domain S-box-containing protein
MGAETVVNTGDSDDSLLGAAFAHWVQDLSDRGIFTTDVHLLVQSWNRWLEAQTGIPACQAIGRHLLDIFPEMRERALDQYYREALAGEVRVLSQRLHRHLIPIRRSLPGSGITEMAQSARIAPLSAGDRVVGTITVIEDVTERVVSERELRSQIAASEHARAVAEEASRLKDHFLATLSHEIRTPLNAVLGWVRILRTQPKEKSREHALEVIERNGMVQLRLVEDLLDMARVVSGKLSLDVTVLALQEIAQAAIDVVAPGAAAKRITIETKFDAACPPVSGDPERLQQAIWNLMSNAVKFTPRDGRIEVTLSEVDDSVRLSVRDTGEGIDPEFLPYVFDRFRQADSSASRRHGGLGLGLALVQQIVGLHGGSVSAQSAGTGEGATFSITLPAAATDSHAEPPPDRIESGVVLDGISVLIVDDDADGREMLATSLGGYGADVRAVSSAKDAIDALEIERFMPDVMVSDVGMPTMDGYALIRRIRSSKSPRTRRLAAIAVTAYADAEDRMRALAAGYQEHLPKPLDAALLAASIRRLVVPGGPKPQRPLKVPE